MSETKASEDKEQIVYDSTLEKILELELGKPDTDTIMKIAEKVKAHPSVVCALAENAPYDFFEEHKVAKPSPTEIAIWDRDFNSKE